MQGVQLIFFREKAEAAEDVAITAFVDCGGLGHSSAYTSDCGEDVFNSQWFFLVFATWTIFLFIVHGLSAFLLEVCKTLNLARVLTLVSKHARLFGASRIESRARVLLPAACFQRVYFLLQLFQFFFHLQRDKRSQKHFSAMWYKRTGGTCDL
jgi:hypothetical protein